MRTITVYLDEEEEAAGRARRRASPARALAIPALITITVMAVADRKEPIVTDSIAKTEIVKTETVVQIVRVPATCEPFGPPAPEPKSEAKPKPRRIVPPPALSPNAITFHQPGWESIAIMNPHRVPIRIRRIDVGGSTIDIHGYRQCLGILRPGEHCRFNVFADAAAVRKATATRIDVQYDAGAKPVTMFVRTGS